MNEHEFKPILAEIQDKPPNPLGRLFLWILLTLMVLVIAWMYFAKVDVVVSARGKVVPDGDLKVLQPFEIGVIRKILVKEGDYVKEGQVLVEIDPTVEVADIQGKERNLFFHKLTNRRVKAILSGKEFLASDVTTESQLQTNLYRVQKEHLKASLKAKEKEIEEIKKVIYSLKEEISKLNHLMNVVLEEEEKLKALVIAGAVAEAKYREKVKERLNLEREISLKKNQVEEYMLRLERVMHEIDTIKSEFSEKLLVEAGSSLQQENLLTSEITAVKFKKSKRFITSPVNGYVHLIAVKTVGGIITPAQPLISIVPENTPLVVKAFVLNKDIGFIKPDHNVIVKVDTYDFQKYGTLKGKVKIVSPFSVEDREIGVDGYPVYIKLDSSELKTKDGKIYKIKPGMTVLAEINTGKRRVIELILFPFVKYIDEGLKVR
uniref:HlyD family type I secretion periplasmic adaptor subunit n=1 Tax=Hydrogenobacter sp. TaxID=2152829 RepID=A0A7C2V7F2_9AQUI